jgi:hypothetical protein
MHNGNQLLVLLHTLQRTRVLSISCALQLANTGGGFTYTSSSTPPATDSFRYKVGKGHSCTLPAILLSGEVHALQQQQQHQQQQQ